MKRPRLKTVVILFQFLPILLLAQENVGLPFLKIGTGARQTGMGGAFTGVGDDIYTLSWNPGGLGHLRRWQWSAAYNRWFSDVYQATFSYAKQFRAVQSRKTSFGLYATYLGMPDWDATGGAREAVSANHFVGGLTIAQRLDYIHPAIAIGGSFKVINSQLANYAARGAATDWGIHITPRRHKLGALGFGLFDYGLFTFGASLLHVGVNMKFDSEETSLPMTWRTGASYLMGRYKNLSMLLASDVIGVRNKEVMFAFGAEIWWQNMLGARCGYRIQHNEDLGDFSFGFGFRWEDAVHRALALPTRFADAFELDFAGTGYGEVLDQTYRGALSHYSIAPEPFLMEEAREINNGQQVDADFAGETETMRTFQEGSKVEINWEKAFDPDPFDEVGYLLVIDKDEAKVKRAIRALEYDMLAFLDSPLRDSLEFVQRVPVNHYTFKPKAGGIYYWAVAAHDLSHHAQLAKKGKEAFAEFIVAVPDIQVKEIAFQYSHWITTTPEQGYLSVVVSNSGTAATDSFNVVVQEGWSTALDPGQVLFKATIPDLGVQRDTLITFEWFTMERGSRPITVIVDPDTAVLEYNEKNNTLTKRFITIPKGQIIASDTVEVMATGYDSTDVPVVPEVYFETDDATVLPGFYTTRFGIPGFLKVLQMRLDENPEVVVKIMGAIDAKTPETDIALADQRAEAVRDKLIEMGVGSRQLKLVREHPDKINGQNKRQRPQPDYDWVNHANRVVTFSVPEADEVKLFSPITVAVDTTLADSVEFLLRVRSASGVTRWELGGERKVDYLVDSDSVYSDTLWQDLYWKGTDREKVLVPRDRWYDFRFAMVDRLERTFYTRPDSIFLQEKRTIRRQEVFGAAKFAKTEPVYSFYWDRLMDLAKELAENPNMHIQFQGHACKIGAEDINQRLSQQRAERFSRAFLDRIRQAYPNRYDTMRARVERPEGYGEYEPLRIKLQDYGEVMLGTNQTPVGRFLNRRISVLLYREN